MSYPKIISFFFLFIIGITIQGITAQSLNINGDTIFVNMEAEVQIIFPTPPKNFNTIPENTEYRIWNVGTGINLIPGSADNTPVTLSVSEADRNHKFILIFKQEISKREAKLYYDYATINKLAQHVRVKTLSKSNKTDQPTVRTEPVKDDKKKEKKEIAREQPVDSSLNYYVLLTEGDKYFAQQNYESAALSFNNAHALRPNDRIPLERLEEIKIKLGEKEKSSQQANDKKFLAIMEEAKIYLNEQKYNEAQQAYKRALELRPGDDDAKSLLQAVNNYLLKVNVQSEKQKSKDIKTNSITRDEKISNKKQLTDQNSYDSAVKSADNFFKAGDYNNAKAGYSKALEFIKKNYPQDQVNKINKILSDQVVQANAEKLKLEQQQNLRSEAKAKNDSVASEAEIKKKYALALTQGKSSYLKNDFLNAKSFYEQAMNLLPEKEEPKKQLAIINNKLAEIEKENEVNNNYERSIALADSQVIAKAYQSSIATYKQASIIKPLESYPRKQVKYIQSELVLIEKKKREDEERQYNNALARADKAVANKSYEEAKSGYTEALSIHPENEYAQKRLEIISYQLEKEKAAAKVVRDTIPVIPEKKSRRRKSSK
ncbi:MAG: hypothetical protein ABIO55_09330 [Ginsengibacter sp.]